MMKKVLAPNYVLAYRHHMSKQQSPLSIWTDSNVELTELRKKDSIIGKTLDSVWERGCSLDVYSVVCKELGRSLEYYIDDNRLELHGLSDEDKETIRRICIKYQLAFGNHIAKPIADVFLVENFFLRYDFRGSSTYKELKEFSNWVIVYKAVCGMFQGEELAARTFLSFVMRDLYDVISLPSHLDVEKILNYADCYRLNRGEDALPLHRWDIVSERGLGYWVWLGDDIWR